MKKDNTTPSRLLTTLVVYYAVLIVAIGTTTSYFPDSLRYLPFGGQDALDKNPNIEITQSRLSLAAGDRDEFSRVTGEAVPSAESVRGIIMFLTTTLGGTILVMLPITWTYSATKFDTGPPKSFVRALMVLPICAATVVLLIQDSLALAFGLAALVAAVRFRVALQETIDGIYIFAAICVGLAAGIGYLGVATIMALFFCVTNTMMWQLDYGANPVDDARRHAKDKKLRKKLVD